MTPCKSMNILTRSVQIKTKYESRSEELTTSIELICKLEMSVFILKKVSLKFECVFMLLFQLKGTDNTKKNLKIGCTNLFFL